VRDSVTDDSRIQVYVLCSNTHPLNRQGVLHCSFNANTGRSSLSPTHVTSKPAHITAEIRPGQTFDFNILTLSLWFCHHVLGQTARTVLGLVLVACAACQCGLMESKLRVTATWSRDTIIFVVKVCAIEHDKGT
jgi:hypothetical protein